MKRARLAQTLRVSIGKDLAETNEAAAVEESARRAGELDRGEVRGQSSERAIRGRRRGLQTKRLR